MSRAAPITILLSPPESVDHALDLAEEALEMSGRGLTYVIEEKSRTLQWSNTRVFNHHVECAPRRSDKSVISVFSESGDFDALEFLRNIIPAARSSISITDPDGLSSLLRGMARIAAMHLGAKTADLHLPYVDFATASGLPVCRPFSVYCENGAERIPESDLPTDLVRFLRDPGLSPITACGMTEAADPPKILLHCLLGTAAETDPITAMAEIKLARATIERGPSAFDPTAKIES